MTAKRVEEEDESRGRRDGGGSSQVQAGRQRKKGSHPLVDGEALPTDSNMWITSRPGEALVGIASGRADGEGTGGRQRLRSFRMLQRVYRHQAALFGGPRELLGVPVTPQSSLAPPLGPRRRRNCLPCNWPSTPAARASLSVFDKGFFSALTLCALCALCILCAAMANNSRQKP